MNSMNNELSKMSLEQLWQLFPIQLVPSDFIRWKLDYGQEVKCLQSLFLSEAIAAYHHIGSTAIQGIWAKPIVDILIEVKSSSIFPNMKKVLLANGYLLMAETNNRLSFNKGYTSGGFAKKVFHIHVRMLGDCDEIYFRNYLNVHEDVAKAYEKLKLSLWKAYEHDRDGYTLQKESFVKKYTELAKSESK